MQKLTGTDVLPVYKSTDTGKTTPMFRDVWRNLTIPGRAIPGQPITNVADWKACRDLCKEDDACNSFEYLTNKECWKKKHFISTIKANSDYRIPTNNYYPNTVNTGTGVTSGAVTGFKYSNALTTNSINRNLTTSGGAGNQDYYRDFGFPGELNDYGAYMGSGVVATEHLYANPSYTADRPSPTTGTIMYGCPAIGTIAGGIVDPTYYSRASDGTYNDNINGKIVCNYQNIDASKVSFSNLNRYFSGEDLTNSQVSWCINNAQRSVASATGDKSSAGFLFDAIDQSTSTCKSLRASGGTFNWGEYCEKLIPDDWYTKTGTELSDWCRRILSLCRQSTTLSPYPIDSTTATQVATRLQDAARTGGLRNSAIRSLFNKILGNSTDNLVSSVILGKVKDLIRTFCDNPANQNSQECACRNAQRGWDTAAKRATDFCVDSTLPGCQEVDAWRKVGLVTSTLLTSTDITDTDRNRINAAVGGSGITGLQMRINIDYDPFTATGVCRIAQDESDNGNPNFIATTLMPEQKPSGTTINNYQICSAVQNVIDNSNFILGGDLTLSCENNLVQNINGVVGRSSSATVDVVEATSITTPGPEGSSFQTGVGADAALAAGLNAAGGKLTPSPSPGPAASNNDYIIWIIVAVVCMIILAGGGLLLFSFL